MLSPRVYYLAGFCVFALLALLVQNLRRSRTGLALGAMRDSEVGLAALGVDVARLKLIAFSLSALLAGIGGAMWSAADQHANPLNYFKLQSLVLLTVAVIGGIGNWIGALAGAVILTLVPPFFHGFIGGSLEEMLPVFFGVGAIGLARNPHGFAEQIRALVVRS
jgi:branched-chain amino acid transport system permease protein